MDEPMISSMGGMCTPTSVPYDIFGGLDEDRLTRASNAVAVWMDANDFQLAHPDASEALARVAVIEYERKLSPVLSSLPMIGVARGGVKYLSPNDIVPPSKVRATWNAWWPRRKAVAARNRVRRSIKSGQAFRKRVEDTAAVWHGTKDAYTDAEIDKLTEDLC